MKIIDFHTHAFPDALADAAMSTLVRLGGITPVLGGRVDDLLQSMHACGISQSLVLPIATKPSQSKSINTFAAQVQTIDGLMSFGSVHPAGDWREELKRIVDLGLKGIKIHPDYQGYFIDDPAAIEMIAAAADLGLVVVSHAGFDVAYPKLTRCTPKRLRRVLGQVPNVKFVAAHMGGFQRLGEVVEHLTDTGVYLDISISLLHESPENIHAVTQAFDVDHILFGSDSPWFSPADVIEKVPLYFPDPADREKVYCRNAEKLLGFN